MKVRQRLGLVSASLLLFHAAPAQSFSIIYKFTKGEERRYKSTVTTQSLFESKNSRVVTVMTEIFETHRTDTVYEDGSADITLIRDSVIVTENKKRAKRESEESLVGIPIAYHISKSGALTIVRALERLTGDQKADLESILKSLEKKKGLVPERNVQVGESWQFEVPITQRSSSLSWDGSVKMTFRFAGTERCGGNDCAIIRADGTSSLLLSGDDFSGTISGTSRGTMAFSIQLGKDLDWFIETEAAGTIETQRGTIKMKFASGFKSELLQ